MSYSENGNGTNFTMPVQPYGGNGGWGNGSFFGDGAWWLIILLLFANNGWGNGFGFGGGMGGMLPFMMGNQQNTDVQRGFDQSAIMGALNGITGAVLIPKFDVLIFIVLLLSNNTSATHCRSPTCHNSRHPPQ